MRKEGFMMKIQEFTSLPQNLMLKKISMTTTMNYVAQNLKKRQKSKNSKDLERTPVMKKMTKINIKSTKRMKIKK